MWQKPFLPHRAGDRVADDLDWWSALLQSRGVNCPIYPTARLEDRSAFSDTSSGIGLGIIVGNRWRAWRLIPGWKTHNGKCDIGWAEAMAFELLIYTIAAIPDISSHILLQGDNTGVVKGWWEQRHRNQEVNRVFRRVSKFTHSLPSPFNVVTSYVASADNPVDGLSRGIFGPTRLLLPPVKLPAKLDAFLIDSTEPFSPTKLRLLWNRSYSTPAAKLINRELIRQQAMARVRADREEDSIISRTLSEG
jgi:hypothetical protein